MIKSIQLLNFKSHKNSKLEFSEGTNLLLGHIGSGKSSVIEAICFALFGTFPDAQRKNVLLTEAVLNKPNQEDKAEIKMNFEFQGADYLVERIIFFDKLKTNQAKLFKNETLIAGPKVSEVTQKIEEILGINYDLFFRAIYTEQNQIDLFLRLSPKERKQRFDELLELHKFEAMRSSAVAVKNRVKGIFNERKSFIDLMDKQLSESSLPAKEKELSGLKNSLEKTVEEKNSVKEKISLLKNEVFSLEEKKKEFTSFNEEKIALESKTNVLSAELDDLKKDASEIPSENIVELIKEKSLLEEKEKQANEKEKAFAKNQNELDFSESQLKEISAELEKLISELNSFLSGRLLKEKEASLNFDLEAEKEKYLKTKEELNTAQFKSNKLTADSGIAEAQIKEEEKHLNELIKAHAFCPVCQNELDKLSKESLILKKNELLKSLSSKLKEIQFSFGVAVKEKALKEKELSDSQNSLNNLEKQLILLKSIKDKDNTKTAKQEKLNGLKQRIELKRAESAILKSELESFDLEKTRAKLKRIDKKIEFVRKKGVLEQAKKELVSVEERIKNIDFNDSLFNAKKDSLSKLNEKQNYFDEKIESLNNSILSKENELTELKERLNQKKTMQESTEKLDVLSHDLNIFINALESTQAELREHLITSINEALNEVWQMLYPYNDIKELKIEANEKDYEINALINGKLSGIEGILSGGERTSIALSLRIALSLVLASNIGLLLLDEPTHNLDKETIESFSQLLSMKLPSLVKQIIIVTHDSNLSSAASGKIFKLSRNKELMESTTINELQLV